MTNPEWAKKEYGEKESPIPVNLKDVREALVKEGMFNVLGAPAMAWVHEEINFLKTKSDDWRANLLLRLKKNGEEFFWHPIRGISDYWYTIWGGDGECHIAIMKFLFESLNPKPEWITMEDILDLEGRFTELYIHFLKWEEDN